MAPKGEKGWVFPSRKSNLILQKICLDKGVHFILYDIQHINSRNNTAMKNHYLITQIADIIMQLYLASEKVQKTVNVTLRNIAAWILESFRKQCLTQQDIEWMKKRTSIYLQ